jgi:predicted ferric reductase
LRIAVNALLWSGLYLCLILSPLLALLVVPTPAKGGFWWEVAVGFGFAALAMMVMQFFLTARLKAATAPFGIDVIYYFHRFLAYALLMAALLHPLIFWVADPGLLPDINPLTADWPMLSGILSLAALLIVMVTSVWRKALRIPYEAWRLVHLLFSVLALVLGYAHLDAVSYYAAAPLIKTIWWLMGLAVVLVVLKVRVFRPWRLLRHPWRVTAVRQERGDACTLTLAPQRAGFGFRPGQFAWLSLGHGPFAMGEHPFSMGSAPRADGAIDFTIKALGDFSSQVGKTPVGAVAWVDGPYGRFSYTHFPDASGYVFICGGIGVAPMFSMLQGLADAGDQRPHLLFVAHSTFERVPRREEMQLLAQRLNLKIVAVLEDPPPGWQGEVGWINREMLARHLGQDYMQSHEFFICGPQAMIDAMEKFLHQLGVPMSRVHTELFDMA